MTEQPQENVKPLLESLAETAGQFVKAWGAYLVAIGVLVGSWTTIKSQLDKMNFGVFEPWKLHLVFGLPVLIAFIHLVASLRRNRLDRRRREWATKGPPKPGYFRLTPYQSDDRNNFGRIDGAHERILSWLKNTDQILLYLSGRSGSGKSSLLNAFVIPSVQEGADGACVINVRAFDDPISEIKSALLSPKAIWERPPQNIEDLPELLQRALQYLSGKRLILVLDQFEEFVILNENDHSRAPLRKLFATLLEKSADFPKLTVMLTLRDDYLELTREALSLPIHDSRYNWEKVELFVQSAALTFLQQSHESDEVLNTEIINQILEEAADIEETPGLFRPITLNMLGIVISETVGRSKGLSSDQVLRNYLKHRLQDPLIRDYAPKILASMATRFKTKRPLSETEIATAINIPISDIQGSLVRLERDGIVRRFDRLGVRLWEISHDFVARLISRVLDGWRLSTWRTVKPWLAPMFLFSWLITLALGLPQFVKHQHERAVSLLSQQNITVTSYGPGLSVIANARFDELQNAVLMQNTHRLNGEILSFLVNSEFSMTHVDLSDLTNLRSLSLNGAWSLKDLHGLSNLTNLKTLSVLDAESLADVSALSDLTNLWKLNLGARNLTNVNGLSGLTNLQSFSMTRAKNLTDLNGLSGLTNLESLFLYGAESLTDLSGLSGLTNLSSLSLVYAKSLTDLSGLSGLINVKTLTLFDVENLTELSGLSGLTNLLSLDITDATNLTDISSISGLTRLESLYLPYAKSLTDISALSGLTNLQILSLRGAESLADVRALSGLTNLYNLDLDSATNLTDRDLQLLVDSLVETKVVY